MVLYSSSKVYLNNELSKSFMVYRYPCGDWTYCHMIKSVILAMFHFLLPFKTQMTTIQKPFLVILPLALTAVEYSEPCARKESHGNPSKYIPPYETPWEVIVDPMCLTTNFCARLLLILNSLFAISLSATLTTYMNKSIQSILQWTDM